MPEISDNALMMSIQAVHQIAAQNSAERDAATGSEQADYDEIIEAYEIAAMELRHVYEKACLQNANLPPYGSLLL
ncbi:hypothetical protein [Nevskia sp.]|uniref:hypothetical protein n=1 Tax=Nevskia sp. TaxID=1929292 RepID=UPI0026014733|nr:hypothetical protein [Nevskia sp.]